jgi:hypothetical protein
MDRFQKASALLSKYSLTWCISVLVHDISDAEAEAEAEAPEAVYLWWKQKRKRLEICRFRFRSVSKLLFKFW